MYVRVPKTCSNLADSITPETELTIRSGGTFGHPPGSLAGTPNRSARRHLRMIPCKLKKIAGVLANMLKNTPSEVDRRYAQFTLRAPDPREDEKSAELSPPGDSFALFMLLAAVQLYTIFTTITGTAPVLQTYMVILYTKKINLRAYNTS